MNIEINDLSKVYRGGVQALNAIDMTIPGGMFGLLGPNGAGKTTLMRILAGILRPTSGTIHIGEFDIHTERGRTSVKRILGYLPQDLGMNPDLSAREFLDYVGILKGMDNRKARRQRVEELLETVSLSNVANRKLKTYSGGMKRRIGIAQALLNDPKLLIVDEPTAGLDPEERIRFRNLLSDLGGDRTVLLSTHIVPAFAPASAPSLPSHMKFEALSSATMLMMTPAPLAASRGEPATCAPATANGLDFSTFRLNTVSGNPLARSCRAMPEPMRPSPRNAMCGLLIK